MFATDADVAAGFLPPRLLATCRYASVIRDCRTGQGWPRGGQGVDGRSRASVRVAVTGAQTVVGRSAALALLDAGHEVFEVEAEPLWDEPEALAAALQG